MAKDNEGRQTAMDLETESSLVLSFSSTNLDESNQQAASSSITMGIDNQAAQIGYDVVALFVNDVNEHYIVHLGFQPLNTQYMPPNEKITLQFTEHQATKGYFQPDNNPQKSLFYYINPDELAQIWGVQFASRAILYSENTGEKFPTPRKNPITNNHFGYFLTWAGLAVICIAFMGIIYYNHKKLRKI